MKIWGILANGKLDYWVLPADPNKPRKRTTHMNGERYNKLINSHFKLWRQSAFGDDRPCYLVQDHEKCLWQARNLDAARQAGCAVIPTYPKSSPDLNAIEGAWALVRARLETTQPVDMEDRAAFLARLRRAAHWVNTEQASALLTICANQKESARDVIRLGGARTKR